MRRPLARMSAFSALLSTILVGSLFFLGSNGYSDEESAEQREVKDRYSVPDGDAAALVKFIEGIQRFRPSKVDEFLAHRKKGPDAIKKAALKILELEKESGSAAYGIAQTILLDVRVKELMRAEPEEQARTFQDVARFMHSAESLTRRERSMALNTASILERSGNTELAIEAFTDFGKLFAESGQPGMVQFGEKMLGAARRAQLLGNELEIEGTTVLGKEFDWAAYRGKVVLIDFWATWCGPCVAELPNVKKNYLKYKDRGFDVVGISLDTNRQKLMKFIEDRELPWVTLFETGAGWDHPVATYYGVMSIPMVILVDSEGKVVSLNARGSELDQQLEKLMSDTAAGGD